MYKSLFKIIPLNFQDLSSVTIMEGTYFFFSTGIVITTLLLLLYFFESRKPDQDKEPNNENLIRAYIELLKALMLLYKGLEINKENLAALNDKDTCLILMGFAIPTRALLNEGTSLTSAKIANMLSIIKKEVRLYDPMLFILIKPFLSPIEGEVDVNDLRYCVPVFGAKSRADDFNRIFSKILSDPIFNSLLNEYTRIIELTIEIEFNKMNLERQIFIEHGRNFIKYPRKLDMLLTPMKEKNKRYFEKHEQVLVFYKSVFNFK